MSMKKVREEATYEEDTQWGKIEVKIVNGSVEDVVLHKPRGISPLGLRTEIGLPQEFFNPSFLSCLAGLLAALPITPSENTS